MIQFYDERRDIAICGDKKATIFFSVEHFIKAANEAIDSKGSFTVALSGGSTPEAIFQSLASHENRDRIDWSRVFLFWSDERALPPDDKESNFRMAMMAGFATLPLKPEHIFRMKAEDHIEENALHYQKLILENSPLDFVMLGMGEDGHTASLFPETHGLHSEDRLVIANYIPHKKCWRMTLTYECINASKQIVIYAMGSGKAKTLKNVLQGPYQPDLYPIQKIGTEKNKALWILDAAITSSFLTNH